MNAEQIVAEAMADRVTWGDGTEYISVKDAARLLTEAKAAGLREAADDIESDWAAAWGGNGYSILNGHQVAELVAQVLRSMAMEVES